ncbi:MAG: Uma2 family endonuclease [Chloroflexi bacterium]|nr:MAG: Uma2 family endonuclease [Chloroflexota bacterium]
MTPVQLADRIDERCLTFYGISWLQFEAIEAAFANISGVRFAYLDGTLDIMTVSPEHEDTKGTIRALVEAYMREKGIRFYIRGGPTLGSQELGARKEPDESYNLNTKKDIPDLAIEVVITSGGIDKLELYKRVGVPEVWFWQDGVLDIYVLKEDYEKMKRSQLLPNLDIEMLMRYITYFDQYDAVTEFINTLRQEEK